MLTVMFIMMTMIIIIRTIMIYNNHDTVMKSLQNTRKCFQLNRTKTCTAN